MLPGAIGTQISERTKPNGRSSGRIPHKLLTHEMRLGLDMGCRFFAGKTKAGQVGVPAVPDGVKVLLHKLPLMVVHAGVTAVLHVADLVRRRAGGPGRASATHAAMGGRGGRETNG